MTTLTKEYFDKNITAIEKRFDDVEKRFDSVENRIGNEIQGLAL